jgi:hypothetical protein
MKADYQILIDGADVSANFGPVLESLSLTDSDGGKSDTLDIVLNDMGAQLLLPRVGAPIQASIWWAEVPSFSVGGAVSFSGVTDEPKSTGARGHGMLLAISAKSADQTGAGKQKKNRQQDRTTFGAVAQQWGQESGYQVSVDSALASIQRDYWAMHNESFLNWGRRIARELGATFKTAFPKAAFVPRNSGASASGQALPTFPLVRPGNLLAWSVLLRPRRGSVQNRLLVDGDRKRDGRFHGKLQERGPDPRPEQGPEQRRRFGAPVRGRLVRGHRRPACAEPGQLQRLGRAARRRRLLSHQDGAPHFFARRMGLFDRRRAAAGIGRDRQPGRIGGVFVVVRLRRRPGSRKRAGVERRLIFQKRDKT